MSNDCSNSRNLPAVICVCTPERKENYNYFEGGSMVNNDGIKLLSFDDLKEIGLQVPNDTKTGSLLIRYPFSQSRYINVEDVDKHRSDKYFKYREILSKLGAKKFSVIEATKTESTMHFDEKGRLNIKAVKGNEKVDVLKTLNAELGFGMVYTATGITKISDESYEEALKLVREYNLSEDDYLISIINTRNPKNENRDKTLSIHMKMMEEFNKKIEIAAAFQSTVGLFGISAQAQHSIHNKADYFLKMEVEFP